MEYGSICLYIFIFLIIGIALIGIKKYCHLSFKDLLTVIATVVGALLASGQIWQIIAPHIHNPLDQVRVKVWKYDYPAKGCFLGFEAKNESGKFLDNVRLGWSELPVDTWAAPLNSEFEETDKFVLVKNGVIKDINISLAPRESVVLRIVMKDCKTSGTAWFNWHGNKVRVIRTDLES